MPTLPISRLINVAVDLAPKAAQAQDLSTLLILGTSDVIDVVERLRTYGSLADVAADFGVNAPEYLAAVLWFSQSPQPTALKVGRWALGATSGKLLGAPLSAANSLAATWAAINNGNFGIDINGAGPAAINGIDFTGVANLNAVAAKVTAALAGCVCTYNSVYNRFEFESATAGVGSSVSFLTAGAATDISAMLGGLVGGGGYVADGIDAESALASATLFDQRFGQTWYGLTIPAAAAVDQVAVAGFIEAAKNKHLLGVSTQDATCLQAGDVTSVGALLKALGYNRTLWQYSASSPYSICSFLGRLLTVDYNGVATAITMKFKQEPGIVAENLTESQADALEANNGNVFVAYNNGTAIVEQGTMASGIFADDLTDTDWLAVTIATALYNTLYQSPTKIPQTDAGIHILMTTVESVCSQGVQNGILGPGTWDSDGFGTLNSGDFLAKGFYVYAQPLSSQTKADRAARKSPPIKVAAKLAGAIHSVDVTIDVNR